MRHPPAPSKWKHLSDGPVTDYGILKIKEMTVESPRDGQTHPRVQIACNDWVHVIATTEARELILIRQFRCGIWENTLEVPGGIIDGHEAPEDAARRELEEETGYVAKHLKYLGFSHPNPAIQTNRLWAFSAEGCEKRHEGRQDEGEDIRVELHPKADLRRLVKEGQITHALVLAAFFLEQLGEN